MHFSAVFIPAPEGIVNLVVYLKRTVTTAMCNGATVCLLGDDVIEIGPCILLVDCFFRPLKLRILVNTLTAVHDTSHPLE